MSGFNTSTRREDVSLKLRSSNMRQTREQTKKLEEENRKMEDRLNELKTAMGREKEKRERQGGGFWGKGQSSVGSLTSYASEVLNTRVEKPIKEGKKKKIKVLQDEPIDVPKRSSQPGTIKYIAQRKLTTGSTPRDKQKGPKCGQCEERMASLSCVQCSEIYCTGCFAAFHLKGALKQHRSCPISAIGGRVCMSPRPSADIVSPRGSQASGSIVSVQKPSHSYLDGSEAAGPPSNSVTPRQEGDTPSLLQGHYNESESAASFQEVLKAWRQGEDNQPSPTTPVKARKERPIASPVRDPIVAVDCSTGTVEQRKTPDIKFTGSLSYVEKLMLKKHRRTELGEMDTPRLDDQSRSSSRLSSQSNSLVDQRKSKSKRISSPLNSERNQRNRREVGGLKEASFVDEGDRIDFQSLYNAVLSSEGSTATTPRSDLTCVQVSSTAASSSSRYPSSIHFSNLAAETMPLDSWGMEDLNQSSAVATPREQISARKSRMSQYLPHEVTSTIPDTPFAIEEMFSSKDTTPSQSQTQLITSPTTNSFHEQQENLSLLMEEKYSVSYVGEKEKNSFVDENKTVSPSELLSDISLHKKSGSNRPKSSMKKDRTKSSMSRPGSRAQSRAASRMRMAEEGILTKAPSKALSQIAHMADQLSSTSMTATYHSPLEGFFLVGVDLSALGQNDPPRTITPRKTKIPSSSQRPCSRAGLKSSQGGRDAIKVSNRLYQMAPRSWRPDSSLGDTVPLDNVHIDVMNEQFLWAPGGGGNEEEDEDMVLSYSYSGQISGRATEWRPASSQSSAAPKPWDKEPSSLYQQQRQSSTLSSSKSSPLSSSHPAGDNHFNNVTTPTPQQTSSALKNNKITSRTTANVDDKNLRGSGDITPIPDDNYHNYNHQIASPIPPSIPKSSSARRKSAPRHPIGVSSSISQPITPTLQPISTPKPPPPSSSTSSSSQFSQLHSDNEIHSNSPQNTPKNLRLNRDMILPSKSGIPMNPARKSDSRSSKRHSSKTAMSDPDQALSTSRSSSKILRSSDNRDNVPSSAGSHRSTRQLNSDPKSKRPSSSNITAPNASLVRRQSTGVKGQRPNSSSVYKPGSGKETSLQASVTASQSLDMNGRQDSIIADVMSTRINADGWMGQDSEYTEEEDITESNNVRDKQSHWETEVRPFTRESLDSAKVRGPRTMLGRETNGLSSRPSTTMSGRVSQAIVMDGDDLSVYDSVSEKDERNHADDEALQQLEWELASDTGRLTADGQISRLGLIEQEEHSRSFSSSSRSSSNQSVRFSMDRDYDLNSKLLESEKLAEQVSLNVEDQRNHTMDEDEVRALR